MPASSPPAGSEAAGTAPVDVVVVGAGIIGAACAHHLTRAGARVVVVDAGPIAGGTSSAGEGNILVSDRPPGPELELALWSRQLWDQVAVRTGTAAIEFARKGGLVVAGSLAEWDRLAGQVAAQREAGVEVTEVAGDALAGHEPRLAAGLAGGAHYPQDAQVQPMLATAHLLRGIEVRTGRRVEAVETDRSGAVTGVWAGAELIRTRAVVNAAGVGAGDVAAALGTRLPVEPRRGFILVTEPLAARPRSGGPGSDPEEPPIRHKVYAADYVATVASDDPGLHCSAVVEGTRAGTILIGSSRERRAGPGGFGTAGAAYPLAVLRRIAAGAVALFPFLAQVRVLRAYRGFRPFVPDHLPVIGPDPEVAGVWHACGHEGAGIGLAPATGAMIAAMITGGDPAVDPAPYAPARFR